jgi:hypothetical protein
MLRLKFHGKEIEMSKDTGGPAFPTENERQTGANSYHYEGMTLRDYFAAKSLLLGWKVFDEGYSPDECSPENIAKFAYLMADAMLAEREKGN